jgi:hypothetical protein
MNHTIEQLIERINVMHDKAMQLHRKRNEHPDFDESACQNILDDIQSMALLIAKDNRQGGIESQIDPRK